MIKTQFLVAKIEIYLANQRRLYTGTSTTNAVIRLAQTEWRELKMLKTAKNAAWIVAIET